MGRLIVCLRRMRTGLKGCDQAQVPHMPTESYYRVQNGNDSQSDHIVRGQHGCAIGVAFVNIQ